MKRRSPTDGPWTDLQARPSQSDPKANPYSIATRGQGFGPVPQPAGRSTTPLPWDGPNGRARSSGYSNPGPSRPLPFNTFPQPRLLFGDIHTTRGVVLSTEAFVDFRDDLQILHDDLGHVASNAHINLFIDRIDFWSSLLEDWSHQLTRGVHRPATAIYQRPPLTRRFPSGAC